MGANEHALFKSCKNYKFTLFYMYSKHKATTKITNLVNNVTLNGTTFLKLFYNCCRMELTCNKYIQVSNTSNHQ